MGFFNKKDDVLGLELTAYGRYLLSQGELEPVYYAFFDDDILYDLEAAGAAEFQNDAERRIKYNTPSIRTQPNRTGAETRTNEFLLNVTESGNFTTISDNSVKFVNRFNNAPNPFESQSDEVYIAPLGNSDMKTDYAPAWHINMLHGEIASSLDYRTSNLTSSNPGLATGFVQNIPQLDITLDYKTFFTTDEEVGFLTAGPIIEVSTGTPVNYTKVAGPLNMDSIALYVEEDYLLVDIQEINGIFGKENFDVQVYSTTPAFETTKATATIFLVPAGSTGPLVNNVITLRSTDGTSITYTGKNSEDTAANEFDISGGNGKLKLTSLAACIRAPEGHNGKIIVEDDLDGNLTLTQAEGGSEGNTHIAENLHLTDVTNFTGGTSVLRTMAEITPLSYVNQDSALAALASDTVEYHLNVAVDKEIPIQIQEAHDIKKYIDSQPGARLRLGRDLYGTTPNEEPCE